MKKKFTILIVILLIAMMAIFVVACNKDDEYGATEASTNTPTEDSTQAPEKMTTDAPATPTEGDQQDATEDNLKHIHKYTEKVVSEKYIKTVANCSSASQYFYSCECGAVGSDTFLEGSKNATNHTGNTFCEYSYVDNSSHRITEICRKCNNIISETNVDHEENCIICLEAGIYDSSNNLLATWAQAVENYGWDVEKNYEVSDASKGDYYARATSSPYYILKNVEKFAGATKIVVSSDISDIGKCAFYSCGKITSIAIKDSKNELFTISEQAFAQCVELVDVRFPNSLTHIMDGAFAGCSKLETISIPSTIIKFGNGAFANCDALSNVYYEGTLDEWLSLNFTSASMHPCINGSNLYINGTMLTNLVTPEIAKINSYAFYGCTSIVNITITKGVRYIDTSAFMNCSNLETVKMHKDSVVNIKNKAFYDCISLKELQLSDTIREIGEYTFYNCDGIKSLTLTEKITSIGKYCFAECNALSRVYFNISYRKIPLDRTFVGCTMLTTIEYSGTTEEWYKVRETYEVVKNENGYTIAGIYWDDATGEYIVNCSDGMISKKDIRQTRTLKSRDEI